MQILSTSIEFLKGVGPLRAGFLAKELGVSTYEDLLMHFPFRYVDRTHIHSVIDLNPATQYVQLRGVVSGLKREGKPGRQRLSAIFRDDSGSLILTWFKSVRWIEKFIEEEKEYIIFGKPTFFKGRVSMVHPEMDLYKEKLSSGMLHLQPVYPSTEKLRSQTLDSKGISRLCKTLFEQIREGDIPENLPVKIIQKYRFCSRYTAFRQIHFPENENKLLQARRRLKFEELFFIQLSLIRLKYLRGKQYSSFVFSNIEDHFKQFYHERLGFELTGAQKRVLKEIRKDLLSGQQMNRLLQGDVGSGKTIVALMSMLMATDNGFQACLMAPTEILARQHFISISEMLEGMPVRTGFLSGSVKGKKRKDLLRALEAGELHLLIGTHALVEDTVQFKNLGLVVIDEQHRFGVAQRASLWKKNDRPPHILVMTATPIPRTLAMTLYGDLDTSIIDELPPGRKDIRTLHKTDQGRLRVYGFMKEQIRVGRQVYVVYPLIEESEKMDYKDLMDGYESICREFPRPDYHVSVVHGRMKGEDKDFEMKRFVNGQTQIMVATTVIEVGVNVPNASVMVIESSERFGLAQLHQLRGRVGRGAEQSFCVLMTGDKLSDDAKTRIRTMLDTNDGFRIAEVDMRLRGPGDLTGTQQSGVLNLKLADLIEDNPILQEARKTAMWLIAQDPELKSTEQSALRKFLILYRKSQFEWSQIS